MGVANNLKCVDERISGASDRWKLYRLATVDRGGGPFRRIAS